MESWMIILLFFISGIFFVSFLLWIDWKFKCRKTIRKNNLSFHARGYGIFHGEEDQNTVVLLSGLMGLNSNEWIFEHRFGDEAFQYKQELSAMRSLDTSEYHESIFLELVKQDHREGKGKTRYLLQNMAGLSISRGIPNLIKKRMLCMTKFASGFEFYFSYKNTTDNAAAIDAIRQHIPSEGGLHGRSDGSTGT